MFRIVGTVKQYLKMDWVLQKHWISVAQVCEKLTKITHNGSKYKMKADHIML